jgi:hypothetical protein
MFRRSEGTPLWPANDNDNDLIPHVLVGFDLWETANLEPGGPFPQRATTFTKITSGTPDLTLIHDANVDLGLDGTTQMPIAGKFVGIQNPATGVMSQAEIIWDNVDVTELLFYKKVSLHEIGHLMGLDHGFSFGPPTSVMNEPRGDQDVQGRISQVVTVCDRDKAAEAAIRPWP